MLDAITPCTALCVTMASAGAVIVGAALNSLPSTATTAARLIGSASAPGILPATTNLKMNKGSIQFLMITNQNETKKLELVVLKYTPVVQLG